MKKPDRFLVGALVLLATMIAAADEHKDKKEGRKSNACIQVRTEPIFSPMTDGYVFVENNRRFYLMTIQHGCQGLQKGHSITLVGSRSRVCSSHRAKIEYSNFNIRMPACRIELIEEVENWNHASSIVNEREREKQKAKEAKEKEKES